MSKYNKLSIEVDAIRWNGNTSEVRAFLEGFYGDSVTVEQKTNAWQDHSKTNTVYNASTTTTTSQIMFREILGITTENALVTVNLYDWIIVEPSCEPYVRSNTSFINGFSDRIKQGE